MLGGCKEGYNLIATPNLYVQTGFDPFDDVPEPLRTPTVDVIYVTDRTRADTDTGGVWYDSGRSRSAAFGVVRVRIGDDLDWPALVAASRQARRTSLVPLRHESVTEIARFPDTPYRVMLEQDRYLELPETRERRLQTRAQLHDTLSQRLALSPHKEALVFVHGFANDFGYPQLVVAQLWHFMGRRGVPIAYTWPAGSPGLLRGYTHDRESGEFTVPHLKHFLKDLADTPGLEKINIIAHSRGTDVATTALREIMLEAGGPLQARARLKLDTLVLAAADLDAEVAQQRLGAEGFYLLARQSAVYTSLEDQALFVASFLFRALHRVGALKEDDFAPADLERMADYSGLQFIDARIAGSGEYSHSYFYNDPQVLSDLILLVAQGRSPGAEHGRPLERRSAVMWRINPGYPHLAPQTTQR